MDGDKIDAKGKVGDLVMQNPQALAALQDRLDNLTQSPSVMDSLPLSIRRRVNALKNLQVKSAHIEAKFYKEVHELERKYAALYQPLFDKRKSIVTGAVEPTDEECEWQSDHEDEELADEDSEITLATDFEIGHFFRERIVPRAVLYFTGEALEDDESFEEEELDEGEEEDQEDDMEEDEEEGDTKSRETQPSECKQQ
ncbi:nucleosome assembly protein 1-like 4b isoform X1 [Tachysurus ichikawai]